MPVLLDFMTNVVICISTVQLPKMVLSSSFLPLIRIISPQVKVCVYYALTLALHSYGVLTVASRSFVTLLGKPQPVGWERNDKNKLAPRMVNLSSSMDPVR